MKAKDYINLYKTSTDNEIHKINGYSIFADESMNMRKVRIKDSTKEELKYKYFVLGGIEVPNNLDLNILKDEYKNDDFPIDEVKYKYFSYGNSDFKKALKSKRLNKLFKFLLKNKIYIHVTVLNYLYWGISDIVDSIIDKNDYFNANILKMGMYEGLMQNYDLTYDTFIKYEFPSIPHGKEKDFMLEIHNILVEAINNRYKEGDEEYNSIQKLIEIINKKYTTINSLVLIQDEIPNQITDSLVNLYIQKACLYIENGIIFDVEESIKKDMIEIDENLINELNCRFIDSKDDFSIQLSDVIAGFVARFFQFVSNENEVELFFDNAKINSIEFENIILFNEIFMNSIDKYKFNYTRIMSLHQDASFMRFMGLIKYFNNYNKNINI